MATALPEKPELLALNKIDAVDEDALALKFKALKKAAKIEPLLISAATGKNVEPTLFSLLDYVRRSRAPKPGNPRGRTGVAAGFAEL